MTLRLEWDEIAGPLDEASVGKRLLVVEDSALAVVAELPADLTAQDALEDFTRGYAAGSTAEVAVTWALWENGEEIQAGHHTFTATR